MRNNANEAATEASDPEEVQATAVKDDDEIYSRWYVRGGKFRPVGSTIETLPAGIYEADTDSEGLYLQQVTFPADELLILPGMPIEFILEQINKFWSREEIFAACGFLHKRGILLYGPAGCGKTSIIRLLCDQLIEKLNGVVLYIGSVANAAAALHAIRNVEPNRKILTIIEDIEEYTEAGNSRPRQILSLLDGEEQINHVVHLATTNKPEVLEDRIVKRPGRFDLVIGLDPPVAEARRAYMKNIVKETMPDKRLDEIVKETDGLGLAHLRELLVATHCLDMDLEETLARLKDNQNVSPKIKKKGSGRVGFTVGFFPGEQVKLKNGPRED